MTGMNSTISIAIRKEWLTQSVAVGVGGAGAAAGGGLVLSLKNPPVNRVRRFHSFYSTSSPMFDCRRGYSAPFSAPSNRIRFPDLNEKRQCDTG